MVKNGTYKCNHNQLKSLLYCVEKINGDFYCRENQLTSLKHGPPEVSGHYFCQSNQLKNLDHLPKCVKGDFFCSGNPDLNQLQGIIDFKEISTIEKMKVLNEKIEKLDSTPQTKRAKI